MKTDTPVGNSVASHFFGTDLVCTYITNNANKKINIFQSPFMIQMEYLRIREKENANINEITIKKTSKLTSFLCVNQLAMQK